MLACRPFLQGWGGREDCCDWASGKGLLAMLLAAQTVTLASPAAAQARPPVRTVRTISADLAHEATLAAVRDCASIGQGVAASVVDAGGQQVAMLRGDGARLHVGRA